MKRPFQYHDCTPAQASGVLILLADFAETPGGLKSLEWPTQKHAEQ